MDPTADAEVGATDDGIAVTDDEGHRTWTWAELWALAAAPRR